MTFLTFQSPNIFHGHTIHFTCFDIVMKFFIDAIEFISISFTIIKLNVSSPVAIDAPSHAKVSELCNFRHLLYITMAGLAFLLISVVLLAVFSFTPQSIVNGQKRVVGDRKLSIGFVGIPPLDRSSDPPKDADATARLLIAKLQQYKVPAVEFLTGSQISDGEKLFPVRANIVRLWRDAGLEVGIGGFRHLPFHDQPLDAYIENVEKNESASCETTHM